jgi:ubiquinone biosynthesis protein UbiJ
MTASAPRPWLPRPLRVIAGRALQTALNHALSLDPDTRQRVAALEDRSVQLHLEGPALTLAITVQDGRLEVGPAREDSHLRVRATPGSLLAMALRRDDEGVAPGKVDIAGDAELARRLEKLATQFAPDVEEAFARTFGDVMGVPLAKAVRRALAHARESGGHLAEDTADWLRDEARVAAAPGEVEGFLDGVDSLRERSERLESRLARLEQKLKGNAA